MDAGTAGCEVDLWNRTSLVPIARPKLDLPNVEPDKQIGHACRHES